MQQDSPRLFEIGDIVTWPVRLIDTSMPDSGWPDDVPVQTAVSIGGSSLPSALSAAGAARGDVPCSLPAEVSLGLLPRTARAFLADRTVKGRGIVDLPGGGRQGSELSSTAARWP
jgi:hypothetical protein